MTKIKKTSNSILPKLLNFINGVVESAPLPLETPYRYIKRIKRQSDGRMNYPKWIYKKQINRLRNRKLVEIITLEGKEFIRLTRKGKLFGLLEKLKNENKKTKAWDGKWRLIMWDIPEQARKHREALRLLVKRLGFLQLQKSVFINPFGLSFTTVNYLKESGLIKFIRILRIDKVDNDKELLEHFKIKNYN